MPSRNRTKQYIENGYYHIYNRGVEKRITFLDQQDYSVFLNYLKEYLLPKDDQDLKKQLSDTNKDYKERDKILKLIRLNNFFDEITLLAYCLMPNHFHFFIKQKNPSSIDRFMQSLCTRYTMYFNRKYKRVGFLYQDTYKAVLNQQPTASQGRTLQSWKQPSSYPEYLGEIKTEWIHPEEVLSYFSETNPNLTYKAFIEEKDDFSVIQNQLLGKD